MLERDTVDRSKVGMVQEKQMYRRQRNQVLAGAPEWCWPWSWWSENAIQQGSGVVDVVHFPSFWWKGPEDAFSLNMITDELIWCTKLMDVILKINDKLLVSLDTIDITDHGIASNRRTVQLWHYCQWQEYQNTQSVATDSLHWCTFRAGLGDLKCFFSMVLGKNAGILCSDLKSALDYVGR